MGMGKGVKPGLGHGASSVYYRHNFLFFFFGGGGGGGWEGAGELAFYFKGTLENNSLFLGNKTNVRECLKIILRNKADQKKIFFAVSLPAHLYSPYPTHFMVLLGNNYSFLVLLLEKKSRFFPFTQQRKKMHAKYFPAYLPIPKYRVGELQILNLKNDPLLENVVNDF